MEAGGHVAWPMLESMETSESRLLLSRYGGVLRRSGNLTKEFMRRKKNCVALDKLCGEHHDVLYPQGIRLWVDALSNTVCDSLNWFGTRRSSFVMLCAAQAKRKEENQFWGDTSRLFIVEGNHLRNVTSLLLMNVPCLVGRGRGSELVPSVFLTRKAILGNSGSMKDVPLVSGMRQTQEVVGENELSELGKYCASRRAVT